MTKKVGTKAPGPDRLMGPLARRIIEYTEVTAIAILLAFFLRTFVVQAFVIPTGSMEDTLLRGDHILVNRMVFSDDGLGPLRSVLPVSQPERYDIAVFKNPTNLKLDYIKRMIGLPGDTIDCRDKMVSINGTEAVWGFERHADPRIFPRQFSVRDSFGPIKVGEDRYFMMGDNRDNSLDSRFWGALNGDLIKGKAFMIYWSWTPLEVALEKMEGVAAPNSLAELIWFNITHLGDRLRMERFLKLVR